MVESESTRELAQSSRRLKGAESWPEASCRCGGRRRTTAWWCSGGSEMARSVLQMVIRRGGTPASTEERGMARHCSSAAVASSGAKERVRSRERGNEEEKKGKWASFQLCSGWR
jgi:hypothetical protein